LTLPTGLATGRRRATNTGSIRSATANP